VKKSLSLLLALLLLITCVVIATPTAQAATKKEAPKRVIAFVFDNSGTMYIGDADSSKAWCRATYAMEALATMMNPSDVMLIYPMNPIRIGNDTSKVYTDESPLKVTRDNASIIEQIYTPKTADGTQDTHIEALTCARQGLIEYKDADEKWLILMTDGTEFYKDRKPQGKSASISLLTDEFNQAVQQVNAMYLGVGKEAAGNFKVSGPCQYVERQAKTSAEVLSRLTELGNIIFQRDDLTNVKDTVDIDVSMTKLILFAQGSNVDDVKLSGATPTSTNKLKYTTQGSERYPNAGVDESLQGVMLTYENLKAGAYSITNSANADSIAVYYEPNVTLQFEFTDEYGRKVDPNNLYEGKYIVKYGMVDGGTGELITESDLLGKPSYAGYVSHNGEKLEIKGNGLTGERELDLKMGDTLDGAELTATYLDDYTLHSTAEEMGWGDIVIQPRPAGEFIMKIDGGQEEFSLQKLKEGKSYSIEIFYDGEKFTGDALEGVKPTWDEASSNAKLELTFAKDHWEVKLDYKDPADPQSTKCGKCKVAFSATYTPQGSNPVDTAAELTYNIKDDFSPLKISMQASEDYIVISDLEKTKAIVVTLTMNGKKLTKEQFAKVEFSADCGGIKHDVTPHPESSTYEIKLHATDGISEGDYKIRATAKYTDEIGKTSQVDASAVVTLSAMPLWLKWLIGIGIALLIFLLIWWITHIRVLPSQVVKKTDECYMSLGGRPVTEGADFVARRSGKQLKVQSQYVGNNVGITINNIEPGKESYLYKKQKKRTILVKPENVAMVGDVRSADINGVMYRVNKEGKLVPEEEDQKAFMINNGAQFSIDGTMEDGGRTKKFHVDIPVEFK